MIAPPTFASKSREQITSELRGFPQSCVDAALRFHEDGSIETFEQMLPGMIEFHLPRGTAKLPMVMNDGLRLSQDMGLDSLAFSEMAFKLDDLFGIPIDTREVVGVETLGNLKAFLRSKLEQQ